LRHLPQHAGHDPAKRRGAVIIEYLKNPPRRAHLQALIAAMGIPVRVLLRKKDTPYDEFGLDDPKWTDDQLYYSISCSRIPS
jgi:arsenate reductase-like glutaredoxin family protein